MEENQLASVMSSVAKRLRADFEQTRVTKHHGETGSNRELLVQKFLASQMPGHVQAIHSAEIVTATGEVSPQCDIVLADRSTLPLTDLTAGGR